jgi:hydrogenase nickel incorporation protein HypA/HybF
MHELAICQALLDQVEQVVSGHAGSRVVSIEVQVGPLSGVVPELLQQAFSLARAGTAAAAAELHVSLMPIRVRCDQCGGESEASANRLLCGVCGDWRTRVISGDELVLTSLDLEVDADQGQWLH